MKKNVVIYTAIDQGIYYLKNQRFIPENCELISFVNKNLNQHNWNKAVLGRKYSDKRLNYKWYKMMAHELFPQYEYSLWIDSLFVLQGDINQYIDKYLSNSNIALFPHHAGRNCLYKEGEVCAELKLDKKEIIDKQLAKYKSEGYPENNGLNMTGIIFRRHNEKDVIDSMKDWFEEVKEFSKRDQISFNYIAWKNKLNLSVINEMHYDGHPVFAIR